MAREKELIFQEHESDDMLMSKQEVRSVTDMKTYKKAFFQIFVNNR